MLNDYKKNRGFTIIELLVSIGILAILFALTTINITKLPSSTAQSTSTDTIISDLRAQQTKSMAGNISGGASRSDYGIHFETTSYTLFKGSTYNPSDSTNFIVELDPYLSFTDVTFPGSEIVFNKGSGDVIGYNELSPLDNISITNSLTGKVVTLKINKYGATY